MTDSAVHGTVGPGFEGVRSAFEANFPRHGDKGASVGVYVDGEQKVDLWGGVADVVTGRAWQRDTVTTARSAQWDRFCQPIRTEPALGRVCGSDHGRQPKPKGQTPNHEYGRAPAYAPS